MGNAYNLKVRWSRNYTIEGALDHEDEEYEFLYMVLRKRKYKGVDKFKVLYIGMCYSEYFSERFRSHHKLWDMIAEQYTIGKILIRFGKIILPPGRRISEKLVRDVEAALIQEVQPEYNEMSTYAYRGRELKIKNIGNYSPLPRIIETSGWEWV